MDHHPCYKILKYGLGEYLSVMRRVFGTFPNFRTSVAFLSLTLAGFHPCSAAQTRQTWWIFLQFCCRTRVSASLLYLVLVRWWCCVGWTVIMEVWPPWWVLLARTANTRTTRCKSSNTWDESQIHILIHMQIDAWCMGICFRTTVVVFGSDRISTSLLTAWRVV